MTALREEDDPASIADMDAPLGLVWRMVRAMTLRWPFDTPRVALINRLPDVPEGFGPVSIRHGAVLSGYYPGRDFISKSLFWMGDFDPWVASLLECMADVGETVIDVGANIGVTTLCLARRVGPSGRVLSFEPFPANYQRLRENIAANSIRNVHTFEVALSDSAGAARLSVPDGQQGMARLGGTGGNTVTVALRALDDILSEENIREVSVCKIDVEGHEEMVLAGMKRALAKRIIASFLFQRHLRDGISFAEDPVLQMYKNYGYKLLRVHKTPRGCHLIDPYVHGPGTPTEDFVAVLPGSAVASRVAAKCR